MKKKIIVRISNEIGNQIFMFASAFSIAKKMNRDLLIDDETAFLSKKNISKFALNNFHIKVKKADDKFKFKDFRGYLKRKFLKKTEFLRSKKNFFIEKKDKNKITFFNQDFLNYNFSDNIFLEGHFESEKYFINYKDEILDQLTFVHQNQYQNNPFYSKILNNNSVGICLRQNRFTEGKNRLNNLNRTKSEIYTNEQISYINKSASLFKGKISKPIFYLWSNDFNNINFKKFEFDFIPVDLSIYKEEQDIRATSLFLLSKCKHFITIPSTFSWWGAWLSTNKSKIIMRPSTESFSNFRVNNTDFWPSNWIKIT